MCYVHGICRSHIKNETEHELNRTRVPQQLNDVTHTVCDGRVFVFSSFFFFFLSFVSYVLFFLAIWRCRNKYLQIHLHRHRYRHRHRHTHKLSTDYPSKAIQFFKNIYFLSEVSENQQEKKNRIQNRWTNSLFVSVTLRSVLFVFFVFFFSFLFLSLSTKSALHRSYLKNAQHTFSRRYKSNIELYI